MYICMRTTIHVFIPSANEGMHSWLPETKAGQENIILMFKEWVEEHSNLDPCKKVVISTWRPDSGWRYEMTSTLDGFADDIEDAINEITRRVAW